MAIYNCYILFPSLQSFLPSHEKLSSEEYVKVMIIFSIAFIAVLLLKVTAHINWYAMSKV